MDEFNTKRINTSKFSVVLASVLIFLAGDNLIPVGYFDLGNPLSLFGLVIPIDLGFIYSLLVSMLVVVGMLWILNDHPLLEENRVQHVFIPALFVFILSVALKQLPIGATFWTIFFIGTGLLYMTMVSEYITVDTMDMRYPLASVGIQTLAYLIFFLFISTLSYGNIRLLYLVVFISLSSFAIAQRGFFLRIGEWKTVWSLVIAFIMTQIVVGFHYLPLRPYQFGVFSVGMLFGLVEFTSQLESPVERRSFILPGSILLFFLVIGAFV